MKKDRISNMAIIISLMVFMAAGCQSGQDKSAQQPMESSAAVKSAQPQVTQLKPPAEEKKKDDTENSPQIMLTKDVHDFGQVGPGSSHKAHYEFKNNGKKTLLVKNIQSTCGCSKPTLIKDGKQYPMPMKDPVAFEPGQPGQVEVTFKAPTTKGSVTKHLYILSDDPAMPRAQLAVKAQVMVKVEVTPEQVELKFGQENAGMPDLVVKSTDGQAFSIKSVTVANKVIEVPFDPQEKATEFTLTPQVNMEKLNQFNTGIIRIMTDHPQSGQMLVRYNAKPMFEVSNPRYILQNIEPETPIIRDNLIRSNYGQKAQIESVTSRNGYMEIVEQQQDGDHIKLSIKITPPSQDSSKRRYITDELTIMLEGGHKLSIRCSGWFRLK